eukprot:SAG25_NODE_5952_length_602_cov_1.632207_1_plen_28_part_01
MPSFGQGVHLEHITAELGMPQEDADKLR